MISAILTALLVYLLPFYIGLNRKEGWSILTAFSRGALFLFLAFALFSYVGGLTTNRILFLKIILLVFLLFFVLKFFAFLKSANKMRIDLRELFLLLFLILNSLIIFLLLFRAGTPYPMVTNWDVFHHTILINNLRQGKFSLILSKISDAFIFNAYTPFFHVLITIPQLFLTSDILGVFWFLDLFHFLTTVLLGYWLAKKIFKSRLAGLIAGLLNSLIFESNMVYAGFFFLPQTLAGLLAAYFLADLIFAKKTKIFDLIIGSLVVFLMHFVIGSFYLAILIIIFLYKKTIKRYKTDFLRILWFFLAIIFLITSLYLGFFYKFYLLTKADSADFAFNTIDKLTFFYQWYGLEALILFPLGCFYIFQKKERGLDLFLVVSLIVLGFSLLPVSYSLKFFVVGRYFFTLVLAAGIYYLINFFSSRIYQYILGFLATGCFFMVFTANLFSFLVSAHSQEAYSFVSQADLEAGNWLKLNYNPKNTFLISDPQTQDVLEALSQINTQGAAFPTLKTKEILTAAGKESDPYGLYQRLLLIEDKLEKKKPEKILFVVSGRYFVWQRFPWEWKKSYSYQVWTAQKIWEADRLMIEELAKSRYFKKVFQNQEMVIFEIT